MTYRTTLAAAALAAATIIGTARTSTAEQKDMQQHTQQANRVIGQATEAAVNDGDLTDLTQYLSSQDRQRLQGNLNADNLDTTTNQIRQSWQQRYNQEFRISSSNVSFQQDGRRADMGGSSTIDPDAVYTDTRRGSEGSLTGGGELRQSDRDRSRDDLKTRADLSGQRPSGGVSQSNTTADDDLSTSGTARSSGSSSSGTGASGSAGASGGSGQSDHQQNDVATGTHGDFRGTSDRIGGRDIPKTAANSGASGGGAGASGEASVAGGRVGADSETQVRTRTETRNEYDRNTTGGGASVSGSAGTGQTGSDAGMQMRGDRRPYEQTGISGSEGRTAEPAGGAEGTGMSESTSTGGEMGSSARTAGHADMGDRKMVTIPASHGMPATTVNMVREGNDWKIDVPDSVDAQQLSMNLDRHLSMVNDNSRSWPQDVNEAYRLTAHHVMAALGDTTGGTR